MLDLAFWFVVALVLLHAYSLFKEDWREYKRMDWGLDGQEG